MRSGIEERATAGRPTLDDVMPAAREMPVMAARDATGEGTAAVPVRLGGGTREGHSHPNMLPAESVRRPAGTTCAGPVTPTGREVRVRRTGLTKDPLVSDRKGSPEGAIGVR
ncbi:hypothetical protein OHB41_04555 [Streptomyces sp. NBC_01571]|uniref:hypothetical protein n=1 Tax=Streptomyces sp. NBC_01571 TaxID=2975883 RepID=UPI00225191DF|nr:hypothetical protein [Streptomyces sp. NBC_01571]MCX4572469.1 hypothetical protein [Streptomyces sp. NBC_01571]